MKKHFSFVLWISALTVTLSLVQPSAALGAENFQIAPPPIAYPYFEPGRTDSKVEPIIINIESKDFALSGGGVNFDGRKAFSNFLAMDFQGGIFMLNGEMPGIPPITLIPAYDTNNIFRGYYLTQVDGKAKVRLNSFQFSFNVEFQPIHGDRGGLIIFGGPSLGLMNMTMDTPYSLIVPFPFSNAGQRYSGFTDTLTITSTLGGIQMGLQGDVAVAGNIRISPFIMVSTASGSSTMKDDPGVRNVSGYSTTADIPSFTTTSMGMDIIVGNLSVGTLLQDMQPKDKSQAGVKITMFRLGYRF